MRQSRTVGWSYLETNRSSGHVSSRRIVSVARGGVKPDAALEPQPSESVGRVQLWDGADAAQRTKPHRGFCGASEERSEQYSATTSAGMVLRCARQSWQAASRSGGGRL